MAKPVRTTSRDPVTTYARRVIEGKITAGPHVRDACRRHLKDLEEAPNRGFFFDLEKVKRALGFFENVLCLNGGEYEGIPFRLNDWQCFVVGSLAGWVDSEGYRRFNTAYIETGKGSGKSPLAAGIGMYGLVADGEGRAEIYAAATKKDQAMVLFRDAVAMVDHSPQLASRLVKSGVGQSVWNLAYHSKGSFFRPISADDGASGPRPHIALCDEVHEHRNGNVVEMLRAGFKFRKQPLLVMITNSGVGKTSYCWERHDQAVKVAAGQIIDDALFSYVCALDENEDPFKDEKCWVKVNPSLSFGLPGIKYLRKQVNEARGLPSKESIVRRLNFCQWVEAEAPWIGPDVWFGCNPEPEFDESLLYGRRCWGGLDLSSTQDLTAFAKLFEPIEADPVWRMKVTFWLPGDGLHDKADRDRVPYIAWRDAGHLIALPGKAINKLAVLYKLAEEASLYNIQKISYDRWRIEDLNMLIQQEGISLPELVPFGQGFKDMAPAVDEFERKLLNQTIRHDGNPVMTWCVANAVVMTDPAGNRKVSKERATGRVDGLVAAIMATGVSANQTEEAGIENWLRS